MRLGWAATVLLGLVALFLLGESAAAEEMNCTVAVVIAPDARIAQITDKSPSTVDFAGGFVVTGDLGTGGFVWLAATTDTGWTAPVEPASMAVGPETDWRGNFTVRVVVPPAVPATTVANLTITATASVEGYGCLGDEVVGTVRPQAYWSTTTVRSTPHFIDLEPGQRSISVTLTLNRTTNLGEDAIVQLRIRPPDGIRSDAPRQVVLHDGGRGWATAPVTVNFTFESLPPGTYQVPVSSDGRGNSTTAPTAGAVTNQDSIFFRVPSSVVGGEILLITPFAAIASLYVAAYLWNKGRRPLEPKQ